MADRPSFPPRTSSRFAPGVYFNVEFGVSLSATSERPPVRAGVQYASRHMQDRIYQQKHPSRPQHSTHHLQHQQHHASRHQPSRPSQSQERNQPSYDYAQARDFQQERQQRLGVRSLEQHERSTSAPPTVDRDELVSPLTPEETFRAVQHTGSFPRERLDRPLPYSPSRFRLGEDELPWSVQPWYRAVEQPPQSQSQSQSQAPSEYVTSPISPVSVSRKPVTQWGSPGSVNSRASMAAGLPSLGFERRERERGRDRSSSNSNSTSNRRREEDPQRVRDQVELQQAMMTVDSFHHDPWARDDSVVMEGRGVSSSNSLGWAVRMEPDVDFAFAGGYDGGFGSGSGAGESGILMSPPPAYIDSHWSGGYRPRSSG